MFLNIQLSLFFCKAFLGHATEKYSFSVFLEHFVSLLCGFNYTKLPLITCLMF